MPTFNQLVRKMCIRDRHEELEKANGQKRVRLLKRLECVDAFRLSGQRPEWMILNVCLLYTSRCV